MNRIVTFLKKESIFTIIAILAIISCFFVKPSAAYLDYINWKTIILLFVMMVIVQTLNVLGIFNKLVYILLNKVKTTRNLVFVLVFICFFTSILITNDIALITFVPFAIIALKKANSEHLMIYTVVLQTIGANMGSMLLPTGSPHNILAYTVSGVPFYSFMLLLLPYVVISGIFLFILCLIVKSKEIDIEIKEEANTGNESFFKQVFCGVDYVLLLTFIAFFIFTGNIENIEAISLIFKNIIVGNELVCSILASQVISNVPATMLITGFSTNYEPIIIGINIGGLGSLVASLANLISYKIYVNEYPDSKLKFIKEFSIYNVVLMVILLIYLII